MIISQLLYLSLLCTIVHDCYIMASPNQTVDQDHSSLRSNNNENEDIFFDEEDSYDFLNEYLDTAATDRMINSIDPTELMTILNLINYPEIVQIPLFIHTNTLK